MLTIERELIDEAFGRATVRALRSIAEFAEDEIVLPSGPDENLPFRLERHPVSRLLFDAVGSGEWSRMFITGPNQDGKTLMGFVVIVMYLLFERGERVIVGVPTETIAADKWHCELLPVIERTRYAAFLPGRGAGARGGKPDTIQFGNGAVLRIMTAGGDDQSRAGFTAPNVVVTETEGFDETGSSSREGTKFAQLEKRVLAYEDGMSRVIAECTVSTEAGRTWHEYTNGTQSRIALPCPHCEAYVTPEREHFTGWQGAKDEHEAAELAAIHCPSCGAAWTNDQRMEANRRGVLVHRGQDVLPDGTVTGDAPKTSTLGFRWTCVNAAVNPKRMLRVARQEWAAANLGDGDAAEAAEKDLLQAHWVLPSKPQTSDVRVIEATKLQRRFLGDLKMGEVPDDADFVTVGCDVGRHLLHWTAISWRRDGSPHSQMYNRLDVPSGSMADEIAIPNALRQLRDEVNQGWKRRDGTTLYSSVNFVDAGYHRWTVLGAIKEFGEPWWASTGYGVEQRKSGEYKRQSGARREDAGEACALMSLDGDRWWEFDADHWKGWFQNRIVTPTGEPGGFTLFHPNDANGHLAFAKHLTNEKQIEEFVPGVGMRKRWANPSHRPNHWLDSSVLACVAGHIAGNQIADPNAPPLPAPMRSASAEVAERDRERTPGQWLPHVSNWVGR